MSRLAVDIAPPTVADIDELVVNMRDQDVEELRAVGYDDPRVAVERSIAASKLCWTARVGGKLACIFGLSQIGTVLAPVGAPWMLGTPLVPQHKRSLARLTPRYIAQMLKAAPDLLNLVHARNTVAVQWLKRMGFRLHPAQPIPPYGEPFHLFEMHRF